MKQAMSPATRRPAGVTLIELLVFIMIVSIAVAGVIMVMSYTTGRSADPVRRKQALMLAEGLLEEVQLASFTYCDPTDPGADDADSVADCAIPEKFGQSAPEPAGARPYDNVNDYAGAAGVATAAFDAGGALVDVGGTAIAVNGYTARLTLFQEGLGSIASNASASDIGEVLRVRVEVSYGAGQSVVLDGYRTRYAPRPNVE